MSQQQQLVITLTSDAKVISACAMMMATSDSWITLGMKYDHCLAAFEGPYKEIYMAQHNNELAGFVIIQVCGSFKGYIQTILVSNDFRRQGFGRQLLHFAEQRIWQISPNVFICVSSFNKKALELYLSVGFKLIGAFEHFLKQGFTELLLRKTIGPILGYQPK